MVPACNLVDEGVTPTPLECSYRAAAVFHGALSAPYSQVWRRSFSLHHRPFEMGRRGCRQEVASGHDEG